MKRGNINNLSRVNLPRDKPVGFVPKVSHVIGMLPAKAQVLRFPRELHPGICREGPVHRRLLLIVDTF